MAQGWFELTDAFAERRMIAGLTQTDVAERAGTDQGTISKLELRRSAMSHDRATRVAGAVGLSLEDALAAGLLRLHNPKTNHRPRGRAASKGEAR